MVERATEAPGRGEDARALVEAVYEELRLLAHRERAGAAGPMTLHTTALVHEAWLRLSREGRASWASRAQFFVAAATAMRRILVDRARARGRLKREGSRSRVELDEAVDATLAGEPSAPGEDVIALDAALDELRAFDGRLAQVVELRAFAGLTEAEAGAVLGLSERSVRRDWRAARLWLFRCIGRMRAGGDDRAG